MFEQKKPQTNPFGGDNKEETPTFTPKGMKPVPPAPKKKSNVQEMLKEAKAKKAKLSKSLDSICGCR